MSQRLSSTKTGEFAFTDVHVGVYDLDVFSPGFTIYNLWGIRLNADDRQTLDPITLQLGGGCPPMPGIIGFRFLGNSPGRGAMTGRLMTMTRPYVGIPAAKVTLTCPDHQVCATTSTDSDGRYRFSGLNSAEHWEYSIQYQAEGYYPEESQRSSVRAEFETENAPFGLEKCPDGNCAMPRKRVIGFCE